MRVVFMGTPDFAVPSLKVLIEEGFDVVSVITQPDKPKGRGKKMSMPPVKEEALKHGIEVHQPKRVKSEEFVAILKDINPDVIIVVAFGQILSKEILDIPKFGCINVHGSLLPQYRGAAPINWVVINGEKTTGITTMYMDEGLDTGDMILKAKLDIGDDETAGHLYDRMCMLGGEVLRDTLKLLKEDNLKREKQDDSKSSYAPIMNKSLGNIKWDDKCENIFNLIRGTNPWPSSFTKYNGDTMKIWSSKVLNSTSDKPAGSIVDVTEDGIEVSTGTTNLLIKEIQMPGKKRIQVKDYIRGNQIDKTLVLGE